MKIIITGATGSLGAALTRYFAKRGHELIVVGRGENPPEKLLALAKYIHADINKPFELPEADICIHSAALTSDTANPDLLYATNVIGTENVAKAAMHCKTFIHISSSSVYSTSDNMITEEMVAPKEVLSPYGKSKLEAEEILKKTSSHHATFVLRPRAIYGPADRVLLPRLLALVKNGKLLRPGKMGINLSMTHFENLAHAIECCARSEKTGFHTYNVSDPEIYVLYDVVKKLMREIYERDLPEKGVPIWLLKTISALNIKKMSPFFFRSLTKSLMLDISKIQRELQYNPTVNFDSSVKEAADWVKSVGGPDIVRLGATDLPWK